MWRSSPSSSAAPEVGAALVALSVGVVAAVALGNLAPPGRGWALPLLLAGGTAAALGLRDRGRGWWLAAGLLFGGAACALAPRFPGVGEERVPVRFVGTVRDGWSSGTYGHTNRIRLASLEVAGEPRRGWRELRFEVGGTATVAELPAPGSRIAGSGELVRSGGRPLARPTLQVKSALLLQVTAGGSRIDRLRQSGVAALERAAGTTPRRLDAAALAAALCFGRQEGLRAGEVTELRRSGLAHLLAVSGLNVGLVGSLVWAVLVVARVRPGWRRPALAVALAGFCLVSGGFAPVRRAASGAIAYLLARQLGRPLEPLPTVWGIVAGLLLFEPDVLLSAGFQLSAGVTLALVRWVRPLAAWLGALPRVVAEGVAVAVVAQVAALPIGGAHFSFIPPWAIPANLAFAPFTLAMTALAMAASAAAAASAPLARLALEGVALCQAVLDGVAAVAGRGAIPFPSPGGLGALLFLAVFLWGLSRSRWAPAGVAVLVVGVVGWTVGLPRARAAVAEVRMLPVGDGMSLLLQDGDSSLLVDGGRSPREAVEALAALRVRSLDAVLLTHPDADHRGGLPLVLEWLQPRELIVAARHAEGGEVVPLLRTARRAGVRERLVGAGQRLAVGRIAIDVLSPGEEVWGSDNDASLVAAIHCGGLRLLVTGDIEAAGEGQLLAGGKSLQAAVLQLPHHGSRTSSTAPFLAAVDPVVALAATGERPRFRYPHPDVARRVRERRVVLMVQTQGIRELAVEGGWVRLGTATPVWVRARRGGR